MNGAKTIAFVALCITAWNAPGGDEIKCTTFSKVEIDRTKEVWTPERKETASPAQMPVFSDRANIFDPVALDQFMHRFEFNRFSRRLIMPFAGSVFPVIQSALSDPPFRSSGKLFYDTFLRLPDWCTATLIEDPANPTGIDEPFVILTAAHCVYSPGQGFFPNLAFTRAYNGRNTGEDYSIAAVGFPGKWIAKAPPDDRFDYAFLLTTTKRTRASAPALGISTGATASDWIAVAYPNEVIEEGVASTLNGAAMRHANGNLGASPGPGLLLMTDTPFGKGASGGAWIPPLGTGATGQVISIASVIGTPPNTLVGPIFDSATLSLLKAVRARCEDQ